MVKKVLGFLGIILCLQLSIPLSWASSSPQIRRFLKPLKLFEKAFDTDQSPEEIAEQLAKNNFRKTTFQLEALMRVYKDHHPEELKKFAKKVKKFEDYLGGYVDGSKRVEFAWTVRAPGAVIAYLEEDQEELQEDFTDLLEEDGWLEDFDDLTSEMIETIQEEIEWDTATEDRKFVLSWLSKELKEMDETDFDLDELEDGIHELRRQLRWVTLTAQAMDGLFLKSDESKCPIAEYADLPSKSVAKSKYAELTPSPFEKKPCVVSACLYLALVQATQNFGLIKDIGQAQEMLTEALHETDSVESEEEADAEAFKLVKKHPDYQEFLKIYPEQKGLYNKAKAIAKEIKRTGLLKAFRAEVNSCRK